jgi:hypothetical protein
MSSDQSTQRHVSGATLPRPPKKEGSKQPVVKSRLEVASDFIRSHHMTASFANISAEPKWLEKRLSAYAEPFTRQTFFSGEVAEVVMRRIFACIVKQDYSTIAARHGGIITKIETLRENAKRAFSRVSTINDESDSGSSAAMATLERMMEEIKACIVEEEAFCYVFKNGYEDVVKSTTPATPLESFYESLRKVLTQRCASTSPKIAKYVDWFTGHIRSQVASVSTIRGEVYASLRGIKEKTKSVPAKNARAAKTEAYAKFMKECVPSKDLSSLPEIHAAIGFSTNLDASDLSDSDGASSVKSRSIPDARSCAASGISAGAIAIRNLPGGPAVKSPSSEGSSEGQTAIADKIDAQAAHRERKFDAEYNWEDIAPRSREHFRKAARAITLRQMHLSVGSDSPFYVYSGAGYFGAQAACFVTSRAEASCAQGVRFPGSAAGVEQFTTEYARVTTEHFWNGVQTENYTPAEFEATTDRDARSALFSGMVTSASAATTSGVQSDYASASVLSKMFSANSFFSCDKQAFLMSMLVPIISAQRLDVSASCSSEIARAIATAYSKVPEIGYVIWTEMAAQKALIARARQWLSDSKTVSSAEFLEKTTDRSLCNWVFGVQNVGFQSIKNGKKSIGFDGGDKRGASKDASSHAESPDRAITSEFDSLYSSSVNTLARIDLIFSAISNDVFLRRLFGVFTESLPGDILVAYGGNVGEIVHDIIRFRDEFKNATAHEYRYVRAFFIDEGGDIVRRNDGISDDPHDDGDSDVSHGEAPQARRTVPPVGAVCERSADLSFQKSAAKCQMHKSTTPEDFEWNSTAEINCMLMFFKAVRDRGMVKNVKARRAAAIERVTSICPILKDILEGKNFLSTPEEVGSFIAAICEIEVQEDVNIALDAAIDAIKKNEFTSNEVCIQKWKTAINEPQRVTARTIAAYAMEDSPESFVIWSERWSFSSLFAALDPTTREHYIGEFAARVLWMRYVCVPKSSIGGAAGASWYSFNESSNYLKPISGSAEVFDDIGRFVGAQIDFAASQIGEVARTLERKSKPLETQKRLASVEMDMHDKTAKEASEILALIITIKKIVFSDRGKSMILNSIKSSSILRCQNFSDLENANPALVAFENGVVDTSDRQIVFRRGKIEDFVTKTTKIHIPIGGLVQFSGSPAASPKRRFRNAASEDLFSDSHPDVIFLINYLSQVFPDEDLLSFALRDMASFYFGRNSEKIWRFWSGEGNNSKSILIKILQYGFGEYFVDVPPELVCAKQIKNSSNASPELAQLEGAHGGVLSEPSDGMTLSSGLIKRYTGGDRVFSRKLHDNGKSKEATAKLIMPCNKPPRMENIDTATKNRVDILPFPSLWSYDAPETEEEQRRCRHFKIDPMFEKNAPRLGRALMWKLFHVYPDYIAQGLSKKPKFMIEYIAEYWRNIDRYVSFIDECINREAAPDATLTAKNAYHAFLEWFRDLEQDQRKNVSYGDFRDNITQKNNLGPFFSAKGMPSGVQLWRGIELRKKADVEES